MDKTEIITKTDDSTVVKRKKSSKFGRFLSHLKRKSHHTATATSTTDMSKSKISLSSVQEPSTASISSTNTHHHTHGCSTFSNWFNKNKENVHDKRSSVKHKKYKEVQGTVICRNIGSSQRARISQQGDNCRLGSLITFDTD
ncbi:unnamed protein product [Trichobilharzia regenti]|nr:unnamed protein product [Trichobilharzia regenti]